MKEETKIFSLEGYEKMVENLIREQPSKLTEEDFIPLAQIAGIDVQLVKLQSDSQTLLTSRYTKCLQFKYIYGVDKELIVLVDSKDFRELFDGLYGLYKGLSKAIVEVLSQDLLNEISPLQFKTQTGLHFSAQVLEDYERIFTWTIDDSKLWFNESEFVRLINAVGDAISYTRIPLTDIVAAPLPPLKRTPHEDELPF